MRRGTDRRWVVLLIAGLALVTCGRTGASQSAVAVKRQPYTAEYKMTLVRTLANGATITHVTKLVRAMDSQGRTVRIGTGIGADGTPNEDSTLVQMQDPVAGTSGVWMGWNKSGRITKLPPRDEQHGCWADADGNIEMNYEPSNRPPVGQPPYTKPVTADLGTETIMGLEARGRRITTTIPTGGVGNDRPLVRTDEDWTATTLGLRLRYSLSDPQMGKETMDLVNLNLSEPDPMLFQPPANYKIVTVELHQVTCPAPAQ